MKPDFIEIATYRQENIKNKFKETNIGEYYSTIFVAINENNDVYTSLTPHILKNASTCILLHDCYNAKLYILYYIIDYINENGEVLEYIDENFYIDGSRKHLSLRSLDSRYSTYAGFDTIFSSTPISMAIKKLWQLYCILKDIKTIPEREEAAKLFMEQNA